METASACMHGLRCEYTTLYYRATSAKCNRILHQPGFPTVGLDLRDTDNLSPSTPKESYRTRQSKNNSSRCSIFGNNGKIDSLSDSDDFSEEVIYSQKSPKIDEIIKDFDWELNRFVEYRPPFTRKETLSIKKSI